ncbi:uncharacterized protein K02A2.6-like [Melitaea cinxia]|uniref:uncharacterized protein K02A2.6-like n=1 Tax=Melitaea cinxia TaxID=113334 RepID=UPI001E274A48|nr:uncharacterized protein K02A2.6-like [Melitaea cinxia]
MALAGGSAMIIQEFSTAKCTFKVYKQVFENKMKIHNIDEAKWPQYLISCIGFDIVTLLTELCFPSSLDSKNYKQLVELIERHIEPTQSEITETYKFMKRVQLPNESIAEFVAALKKLAQTCNFGAHLERSLRDKFVHGLRYENIVKRLFNEDKLTFTTAVNIAIGMELAEKGARLITHGQEEAEVQKVSHQKESKETVKVKCHCCGKLGHIKPKCKFREEECYKCHKKGHIASVCRAQVNLHKRFPSRKVKEVNKDEFSVLQVKSSVYSEKENCDYGLELLFYQNEDSVKVNKVTLIDEKCPDPWNISLNVNNVDILFQIDYGSDVTLIPEFLYKSLLPNVKVSNCFSKITGYGGQYITVIGKTQVLVKNKNKDYLAPLIIVKEGKKPLLGRDWLSVIKIDWNSCKKQCNNIEREKSEIKKLVDKYRDIFSGVPGEIKGAVGTLKLKENVTPISCKPRRVPYALENLVKGELDKLCKEGKMCKVDKSEVVTWATPIVSIIKGPKNIRICGDYKVTINPYLEMPHHPIPINKEKTVLMSSQLEYCGHVIDKEGVHKTPEHVRAILEAPQPNNVKELRSFLGTINFYHKFLKNAADNLKPLYQLLKNSGKWEWGKEQVEAYEWAKKAIASDQVLVHYNPELPVILSCDASRTSQNNAAADFPSRLPIKNSSEDDKSYLEGNINSIVLDNPPVTLTDVAKHTQRDPVLSKVFTYLREGWPKIIDKELLNYKGKERELYLIKDCIIWRDRIVIPNSLKSKVLIELHAGHLGINKMQALANSCFWWPNISNDIKNITSNCEGCIQNRNLPPLKHLHNWEWPNEPWKRLHADFAGPFRGHMWLIVMDAHSKWPEVAKMKLTTSSATIKCLRSMFARFGLPEQFVTDNGPQWTSAEFITFCKNNNIRHICTAPYHPASNGLAERGVQTFKKAMLAQTFNNKDLDHSVQQWLLAYRSAPHATTGRAPCELMLGRQLRTRLSLIKKDVIIPRRSVCNKPVKQYLPGDKVLVASYDKSRKWLEGIIDRPVGNVMYDVNTDRGILTRNVTQCLPRNSRADQDESNNTQDMIENDIPGNEVSISATSEGELETSNNSTNSSNAFNNNKKDSVSIPKSPISIQTEVKRSGRMRRPVQRLNL